jgi:uncharacterized coiled-coil protein SlyX
MPRNTNKARPDLPPKPWELLARDAMARAPRTAPPDRATDLEQRVAEQERITRELTARIRDVQDEQRRLRVLHDRLNADRTAAVEAGNQLRARLRALRGM